MLSKVFYQAGKICVGMEVFLEPAEFSFKLQDLLRVAPHGFQFAAVPDDPGVLGQPVNVCWVHAGHFGGIKFVERLPGAGPLGLNVLLRHARLENDLAHDLKVITRALGGDPIRGFHLWHVISPWS